MVDTINNEVLSYLKQISLGLNDLTHAINEVNQQLNSLDQRLALVERCVVNIHTNNTQAPTRTIWSDDERTAFCNWLAVNTDASDDTYNINTLDDSSKF